MQSGVVQSSVSGSGNVEAASQLNLGFKTSGTVTNIYVTKGQHVTADYLLNTEIRAFQIDASTGEAFVEMSAKAVDDRTGRITNARVFNARVPVAAIDAGNAAHAPDSALSIVLLSIVRWVGTGHA